jgi:hypothetical protein
MNKLWIAFVLSLGSLMPTVVYATECSQLGINIREATTLSAEDSTCTVDGNPLVIEILSSNDFTQEDESRTANGFIYLSQILNEKNLNQVSLRSGETVITHVLAKWYVMNNFGRYRSGTWFSNSWKSFSNNTKKSYISLVKKALEFNPTISEESLNLFNEIKEEAVKLDIKL